jgi:VanZ family protein
MKNWIRNWWPAILMMALIFIASGTSGQNLPQFGSWDLLVKKGGHMTGYALLALALLRGLAGGKAVTRRQAVLAVLLAAAYALTDEFHQRFTPGRGSSMSDVAIDTAGAVLGVLAWRCFTLFRVPSTRSNHEASQS